MRHSVSTCLRLALACVLAAASAGAFAEKKALDDEELRGVSGKGIAIAVNLQLNTRQIAGTAPPSNIAAGFNVNGITTYAIVQNFGGGLQLFSITIDPSVKPDGTADKPQVFAEGWLTENGEYLGRPVDVAFLHPNRF